jgi:hypothetical protein
VVTEAHDERQVTQMSARNRRRFLIGFAALMVLLFAGGAFAYVVDFRHKTVCPGGKQWVSQSVDELGAVTYVCPGGQTVTQGVIP